MEGRIYQWKWGSDIHLGGKKIEDYFLLFQYFILKDPKASADAKKEKVLKIEGRIETVK